MILIFKKNPLCPLTWKLIWNEAIIWKIFLFQLMREEINNLSRYTYSLEIEFIIIIFLKQKAIWPIWIL